MQVAAHVCKGIGPKGPPGGFAKILALGWYDGPTEGVAQCGSCPATYRFEMLDEEPDWEEGEDVRIFKLAPLPDNSLDRIVSSLCRHEAPRWPIWVPTWRFESAAEQNAADDEIGAVLATAGDPDRVVASSDGLLTLVAGKQASSAELSTVQDWFRFLGLARRSSPERA